MIRKHNEQTCTTCKIIEEERLQIKKIRKSNDERKKVGKELLDASSRIPAHCIWCTENVVWDGDHWCSEKCYNEWRILK